MVFFSRKNNDRLKIGKKYLVQGFLFSSITLEVEDVVEDTVKFVGYEGYLKIRGLKFSEIGKTLRLN